MSITVGAYKRILSEKIVKEADAAEKAKICGKYKIEIRFMSDRSMVKPMKFSISVWESGGRLHGGGDEKMYKCRRLKSAVDVIPADLKFMSTSRKKPSSRGCGSYIFGKSMKNGYVHCLECGTTHAADAVATNTMYVATAKEASIIIEGMYMLLESNCDLVTKYIAKDPRTIEMARVHGIAVARNMQGAAVKPWAHIMEEAALGRSIADIARTFINA